MFYDSLNCTIHAYYAFFWSCLLFLQGAKINQTHSPWTIWTMSLLRSEGSPCRLLNVCLWLRAWVNSDSLEKGSVHSTRAFRPRLCSAAAGLLWVEELLGTCLLTHAGHLLGHAATALLLPSVFRTVPHAISKVDEETCTEINSRNAFEVILDI